MRQQAEEIVRMAAEAGVKQAWRLLECTPAEIETELSAISARQQMQAQNADLIAFLAGRYVLTALHAPRRYPRSPNAVSTVPRRMSDAQMKRVFANIAARRRKENGGS